MTERLSRLTPNPAAIDRDAILFAAGRQSARASRLWVVISGLLAVSQAATLIALWPRSSDAVMQSPAPVEIRSSPEPAPPVASPPPGVWSIGSQPDVVHSRPSSKSAEFVLSGPSLTAGSALHFD
jgi:hypothetical protein